ncbi:MAG TPA: tRNA (uridine(54)-C5)-methyltransferase TrmA, partial [Campylobacterales bacterium]|nr:tRNA (uridine(54)-C5)-methyltransferase TrmA [Campylobacterales bacterium]
MDCKYFGECGSCTIYEVDYNYELMEKKKKVLSLLSPFGVKNLEVFNANESHYRARAEFRVWHNDNGANYAMGRADRKGAITIDECPKVITAIVKRMKPLLEAINISQNLKSKLFSIEFLATTTDECLITMIYHKKLDEVWQQEAKELEQKLQSYIMGRSRKQKVILSQEFVTEKLFIDNQEYIYRHYESGFTQPNPTVNIKMIEWAIKQAKTIGYGDFLESYCGLGNFTI